MGNSLKKTKLTFPTTAPTNAQANYVIAGPFRSDSMTGSCIVKGISRIELTLRSSHISGTDGLVFQALHQGDTVFYQWAHFTHPAATATDPTTTYFVDVPYGINGFQVLYTNSANNLTAWAGSIALVYDEQAAVV
jgi:hypothetical protein